jgi:hypothetical protein
MDDNGGSTGAQPRQARRTLGPQVHLTSNRRVLLEHLVGRPGLFCTYVIARDTGFDAAGTARFLACLKRNGLIDDDPNELAAQPGGAGALAANDSGRKRHHYYWTAGGRDAARQLLATRPRR